MSSAQGSGEIDVYELKAENKTLKETIASLERKLEFSESKRKDWQLLAASTAAKLELARFNYEEKLKQESLSIETAVRNEMALTITKLKCEILELKKPPNLVEQTQAASDSGKPPSRLGSSSSLGSRRNSVDLLNESPLTPASNKLAAVSKPPGEDPRLPEPKQITDFPVPENTEIDQPVRRGSILSRSRKSILGN
jgi:hypothetical protein